MKNDIIISKIKGNFSYLSLKKDYLLGNVNDKLIEYY